MYERIREMRTKLCTNLEKNKTPGSWNHIIRQNGMFSYTGLTRKKLKRF